VKPQIQKLPLTEGTSFVARTFRTPDFEVGWHQHVEYELILFTEGAGMAFVGNHIGEFDSGDIYFLAGNLPHTFRKRDHDLITSAVVVQFREDFWGAGLMKLPEARLIRDLFVFSRQGLKLRPPLREKLAPLIRDLEHAEGFSRILLLGKCLEEIALSPHVTPLSTQEIKSYHDTRIESVLQFTTDHFSDNVQLSQVAGIAGVSVKGFCAYFKRTTKKTYINFLNEVRVGYACNLLLDTDQTITAICFSSGYNTIANFHKQFLKIKGLTPLQYRKAYASNN
jgi:AraC-like DNA-binding protein